jgi:predicted transcriptional regulator
LYTTTEEGIDFLEQYRKLNGPLMKKVSMGHTMWRQ